MSTTEVIKRKFTDTPPATQADEPVLDRDTEVLVFQLSGRELSEVRDGDQFALINRKHFDRWRLGMLGLALVGMVLSGAVGALVSVFVFSRY